MTVSPAELSVPSAGTSVATGCRPRPVTARANASRSAEASIDTRLRALPGLAGLRLAALTGYRHESDHARTEAAGFAAHFVKPVRDDSLLEFVWGLQAVSR